jgi:hypothetical protein
MADINKSIVIQLLSALPDSDHREDDTWGWCWVEDVGKAAEDWLKTREHNSKRIMDGHRKQVARNC